MAELEREFLGWGCLWQKAHLNYALHPVEGLWAHELRKGNLNELQLSPLGGVFKWPERGCLQNRINNIDPRTRRELDSKPLGFE